MTATLNAPSLLLHLHRNDVELSIDHDDGTLIVEGTKSQRLLRLVRGRRNELAHLLGMRCDWFLDIGLREGRRP